MTVFARSLVVDSGRCTLFSRNGNPFASFAELATRIGNALMPRTLVMDGEIVCLDKKECPQFTDLLFRRREPCFVAFDLLQVSGRDLRREQLIDRKELRRVLGHGIPTVMFADHIDGCGTALFRKACELDVEGIVAKHKHSPYEPQESTWLKIRNRSYSQWAGRNELFERERHQEPEPGWHSCTLAAASAQ
jgi:bifunctional non-homologous end joining protein LigD